MKKIINTTVFLLLASISIAQQSEISYKFAKDTLLQIGNRTIRLVSGALYDKEKNILKFDSSLLNEILIEDSTITADTNNISIDISPTTKYDSLCIKNNIDSTIYIIGHKGKYYAIAPHSEQIIDTDWFKSQDDSLIIICQARGFQTIQMPYGIPNNPEVGSSHQIMKWIAIGSISLIILFILSFVILRKLNTTRKKEQNLSDWEQIESILKKLKNDLPDTGIGQIKNKLLSKYNEANKKRDDVSRNELLTVMEKAISKVGSEKKQTEYKEKIEKIKSINTSSSEKQSIEEETTIETSNPKQPELYAIISDTKNCAGSILKLAKTRKNTKKEAKEIEQKLKKLNDESDTSHIIDCVNLLISLMGKIEGNDSDCNKYKRRLDDIVNKVKRIDDNTNNTSEEEEIETNNHRTESSNDSLVDSEQNNKDSKRVGYIEPSNSPKENTQDDESEITIADNGESSPNKNHPKESEQEKLCNSIGGRKKRRNNERQKLLDERKKHALELASEKKKLSDEKEKHSRELESVKKKYDNEKELLIRELAEEKNKLKNEKEKHEKELENEQKKLKEEKGKHAEELKKERNNADKRVEDEKKKGEDNLKNALNKAEQEKNNALKNKDAEINQLKDNQQFYIKNFTRVSFAKQYALEVTKLITLSNEINKVAYRLMNSDKMDDPYNLYKAISKYNANVANVDMPTFLSEVNMMANGELLLNTSEFTKVDENSFRKLFFFNYLEKYTNAIIVFNESLAGLCYFDGKLTEEDCKIFVEFRKKIADVLRSLKIEYSSPQIMNSRNDFKEIAIINRIDAGKKTDSILSIENCIVWMNGAAKPSTKVKVIVQS